MNNDHAKTIFQRRPLTMFVVLSYGISWLIWAPVTYLSDGDWYTVRWLTAIGSMGPALAAIIVLRLRSKSDCTSDPRQSGRRILFLAVFAFAGAYGIWDALAATGEVWESKAAWPRPLIQSDQPLISPGSLSAINSIAILLNALLVAFVVSRAKSPSLRIRARFESLIRWRLGPWMAVAVLLFLIPLAVGCLVSIASSRELEWPIFAAGGLTPWLHYLARISLFIFLFGGANEEAGWRGFALPELQTRHSPLVASLILGVIWGLWHTPLHFGPAYGGSGWLGLAMQTMLGTVPASILLTWLFNRTKSSLLAVWVAHGSMNLGPKIFPFGGAAAIVLLLMVLTVVFYDRMYHRRFSSDGNAEGMPKADK